MRRLSHLGPHWDSPPHREQIHQAFDRWFVAYDSGSMRAGDLFVELRRLTEEAKIRKRVLFAGVPARSA